RCSPPSRTRWTAKSRCGARSRRSPRASSPTPSSPRSATPPASSSTSTRPPTSPPPRGSCDGAFVPGSRYRTKYERVHARRGMFGPMATEDPGFVSRGFVGRPHGPGAERLPPGQYLESGFPVLTAGPTPRIEPAEWNFRIDGMVGNELEWSRDEFAKLPFEDIPCDIHCVTKWSKLDTSFRGVSVDALLESAQPQGAFSMAYSFGGYTTNLPLEELTGGRAWVVTEHEG